MQRSDVAAWVTCALLVVALTIGTATGFLQSCAAAYVGSVPESHAP